ncbi:nuclear transport factor 2 domain-containing protein [Coniochaeta sp. 2T2.1]|nr:nuclear transport factor 2 domain-containing protein [Coniochaeta sp. 2T2.1]
MTASAPTYREQQQKAASDGASQFVDQFYVCVNGSPTPLRTFYVSSSTKYTTSAIPANVDISVNGKVLAGGPDEYESMLKAQRMTPSGIEAKVRYEVDGWDCQIINPEFSIGCPDNLLAKYEEEKKNTAKTPSREFFNRCSLLVQVTGTVTFAGGEKDERKVFNDVFVLVPNWDTHVKNPSRNAKRWLVLSQNFRSL